MPATNVVFSYARSDQKLKRLAREANGNARAGTPADAARDADALLLAVHWLRIDDVLQQAGDLPGKILVTAAQVLRRSRIADDAPPTLPAIIRDVERVGAGAGDRMTHEQTGRGVDGDELEVRCRQCTVRA